MENGTATAMHAARGVAPMARTASELGLPLSDVVVLLACNEKFVPYLSVALQSISDNAGPDRRYDVVVLSNDLSAASMATLRAQVARDNFGIGFLDACTALGGVRLPRHGHFSRETYYRLLAPELLGQVEKAVYLDSDLVVLDDVAKLFDTDVAGCLLAATQDADTAGQCLGYDEHVFGYLRDEVGLDDPLDYFQAGVLVMNLAAFRASFSAGQMVEVAASRHWHWLDQDVLNRLARGRYRRLDMSWNVLMDWQGLRRTHIVAHAPVEVRGAYEVARTRPRIVHYAGPDDRPWLYPDCDFGELFWAYARRSPYRDELERRLRASRRTVRGLAKRLQVRALFSVAMPLLDLVAPPASPVRRALTGAFARVTGGVL